MIRRLAFLAAMLPLLAGASIQSRIDPNGADVSVIGRERFCAAHADLCTAYGPDVIPDSPQLRAWLGAVNKTVNAAIVYREVADRDWRIYPEAGDCNDFAVTKLAILVNAGLPRRALRLAVVQAGQRERALNGDMFTFWRWHMVLTVETTEGTLVLDSLRDQVADWAPSDDRTWYALERAEGDRLSFARLKSMTATQSEEIPQ